MFKYEEIEKKIEDEIKKGIFKPGEKIPSENEIPAKYNVSKNTARKAIQELLEKGLIYRVQGKGTFVADIKKENKEDGITRIEEEIKSKPDEGKGDIEKRIEEHEVVNKKKTISRETLINELFKFVEEKSGQIIFKCYQCGKCSAGCPVSGYMDYLPNQIIRLLQMGETEAILSSKTIWYCASCFICDTRCPKGIDISKIMEAIRSYLLRKGIDHTDVYKIDESLLEEIPQQALVANLKKSTG